MCQDGWNSVEVRGRLSKGPALQEETTEGGEPDGPCTHSIPSTLFSGLQAEPKHLPVSVMKEGLRPPEEQRLDVSTSLGPPRVASTSRSQEGGLQLPIPPSLQEDLPCHN